MKLEILHVPDKGNLDKERLVLNAIADTDIGEYAVLQTGFRKESVTTSVYHTYWFPYKRVSEGDLIILYTRTGRIGNEKIMENENKAHFFYWGIEVSIWNHENRAPVILYAPTWKKKNPKDL